LRAGLSNWPINQQPHRWRAGVIELAGAKAEPVALYGSDGKFFADTSVGAQRHRFAGVTPDIELYPQVGSAFLAPVFVRAVADQDWRDAGGGHDYLIVSHSSLIDAIESSPNAYYVNVHTAKYPDGAIRGQLVAGMMHM
jgi:hypothetical protein